MTDNHPITPPPELVEQWRTAPEYTTGKEMFTMVSVSTRRLQEVATQAARWGADHELEACCEWLRGSLPGYDKHYADCLHTARRPKPPSLKELALETLLSMQIQPCVINGINTNADLMAKYDILRRALESLPD